MCFLLCGFLWKKFICKDFCKRIDTFCSFLPLFRHLLSALSQKILRTLFLGFFHLCRKAQHRLRGTRNIIWPLGQHHCRLRHKWTRLSASHIKRCCNKLQKMWCFASMMLRFAQMNTTAVWFGCEVRNFVDAFRAFRGCRQIRTCEKVEMFTKLWYNRCKSVQGGFKMKVIETLSNYNAWRNVRYRVWYWGFWC